MDTRLTSQLSGWVSTPKPPRITLTLPATVPMKPHRSEVEHASFTPLIFSATEGLGREAVATQLSAKRGHTYSSIMVWIRCHLSILSFSLHHSLVPRTKTSQLRMNWVWVRDNWLDHPWAMPSVTILLMWLQRLHRSHPSLSLFDAQCASASLFNPFHFTGILLYF